MAADLPEADGLLAAVSHTESAVHTAQTNIEPWLPTPHMSYAEYYRNRIFIYVVRLQWEMCRGRSRDNRREWVCLCSERIVGRWSDLVPTRASGHKWHPPPDTLPSLVHSLFVNHVVTLSLLHQPVCYPTWPACLCLFVFSRACASLVCVSLWVTRVHPSTPELISSDLISSQLADVEQLARCCRDYTSPQCSGQELVDHSGK